MDSRSGLEDGQSRSTEPIYEAAVGCLAIFDEYLQQCKVPEQPDKQGTEQLCSEVEELRSRFKQWAAYIGAFASARASLDARLALQGTTRDMVLELLVLIRLNMRWVIVQNCLDDEGPDMPGLGAVIAAVNRLFVLAVDIRRSARESHQIRPGAWKNKSQSLTTLLRIRYPYARPSLLSQLATSIHTRGASLRYLQRHNEKLAFDRNSTICVTEPEQALQSVTRASNPQASDPAMLGVPLRTMRPGCHLGDNVSTPDTMHSAFSQTHLDSYRARQKRSGSIISIGSAVGGGTTTDEDQYPPIPKGHTKCSICADPNLSGWTESGWKLHVLQDLEPYLCISEECLDPPKFFPSSAEWMDHMQTRHTMDWAKRIHTERWYCHLCTEVEFDDKAALLTHLQAKHGDKLTLSQIQGRTRRNRRIAMREDAFACPLCNHVPDSILEYVPEKPYKRLAQHVARHLKSLSFLSLSYLDIDYGRDEESAYYSKNKTLDNSDEGTKALQGWRKDALAEEGYWDIPKTLILDNGTRTVVHTHVNGLGYHETVETFEDDPPMLDYDQYWHFLPGPNLRTDFAALSKFAYFENVDPKDARQSSYAGKAGLLPPPKPFALIPFHRDPDFIPRGDTLNQIDQRCAYPPHRVALVGLGGVGKSQLAIEFAYRMSEGPAKPWVFWVHAATRSRYEESFRTIANAVKLAGRNQPNTDKVQLVYNWLSNEKSSRWIMVLDSADDDDVFFSTREGLHGWPPLATNLPQSRNGLILITSRNRDLATRLTGGIRATVEVGPMMETEALSLLTKKLGLVTDMKMDSARALVGMLDLLPLTISQAAAYIQARAPHYSMESYIEEFQKNEHRRTRLLSHDSGDLRRDVGASNSILRTWQISFEHIRSIRHSAADLLSLMSFFDRQGIPKSLLKGEVLVLDANDSEDDSDDNSGDGFEEDIATLESYCLIAGNERRDEFVMGRPVQLSVREWLGVNEQLDGFERQYIKRMAAAFPTGEYGNWTTCQNLFAHMQTALDCKPSPSVQKDWATLLHNGGWYAWSQGMYDTAGQMLHMALQTREKVLGREDMATLASMSLLATVMKDQGQWKEAEMLLVQVIEAHKMKVEVDHPGMLASIINLTSIYRNQGRWEEAEKLQVQVLETFKSKLGPDHPDILSNMANLASTYWKQGRWEEAEKLQVQVLETFKSKLGPDHPDTLSNMANLASTYWKQGRWEEAEKLQVQVLETFKSKLGPDHPDILSNMANLASTYWKQGRWEEAEKLQVQVMETSQIKLGADHPDTITNMANLALTLWEQGRWVEAEKLQEQVMETFKSKLGQDHPHTLSSMTNLASTYWKQGRWEEAEKLQVQVMEISQTKLGANHPDTITNMANLASTYRNQGRLQDAEELEVRVLDTNMVRLGPHHPSTLTSMAHLAYTYWTQNRPTEAVNLMRRCIHGEVAVLGVQHPAYCNKVEILAQWESELGTLDAAGGVSS
ncbi:hypothetical protein BGZ63DRAFT_425133 [Mariannaea sp. PMI_226]|nr:hypothetical protein BGZ63DRAFT_425133 [Mariannaea sp. PMI_226]